MRIEQREKAKGLKSRMAEDARRALKLGPASEPVCCADCPDYRTSPGCHRYCPSAAQRLSSEGERGPIEPLIAPLVFELKKLGVFYPCWSCEGHANPEGKVWKLPRVWFYSDSVVHIRALSDAIDRLYGDRQLSTRWQVVVTYSDADNPDTTFSLQPEAASHESLDGLQTDLRVMAEKLERQFRQACEALSLQAC